MTTTVRRATVADAVAIARLHADNLGYDHPVGEVAALLPAVLADATQGVWVAEHAGEVVGVVHAHDYVLLYAPPLVDVMGIAVAASARRLGAGRALMAAVEQWAHERGAEGVRLVSGTSRDEAHRFYTDLGYEQAKLQYNFKKWWGRRITE